VLGIGYDWIMGGLAVFVLVLLGAIVFIVVDVFGRR
jgi:hypothetical protein